jgi:hypothetical protein
VVCRLGSRAKGRDVMTSLVAYAVSMVLRRASPSESRRRFRPWDSKPKLARFRWQAGARGRHSHHGQTARLPAVPRAPGPRLQPAASISSDAWLVTGPLPRAEGARPVASTAGSNAARCSSSSARQVSRAATCSTSAQCIGPACWRISSVAASSAPRPRNQRRQAESAVEDRRPHPVWLANLATPGFPPARVDADRYGPASRHGLAG